MWSTCRLFPLPWKHVNNLIYSSLLALLPPWSTPPSFLHLNYCSSLLVSLSFWAPQNSHGMLIYIEPHCVSSVKCALTSVFAHLTWRKDQIVGSDFAVLFPSLENKLKESRDVCIFCLLLHPKILDQCLAQYRCSMNLQWINEYIFNLNWNEIDTRYNKLCISRYDSTVSIQMFGEVSRKWSGSNCFPNCKYSCAVLWNVYLFLCMQI